MTTAHAPSHAPTEEHVEVLIIGSGFGGLGAAIALKNAGIHDFVIAERANEVGGTWRDNRYPGAACDVQSFLYSYSFEQWPYWKRMFASAEQIFEYTLHCVDKYALRPHVRLQTEITSARWDDSERQWTAIAHDGRRFRARQLIVGTGGLSRPRLPEIPGIERFKGESFHTARWNHDYDLQGKRVAIVGTGASAIQIIPAIAELPQQLSVFQRTPAWVIHKPDRDVSEREQAIYQRFPRLLHAQRLRIMAQLEPRSAAFGVEPRLMIPFEAMAKRWIRQQVTDPKLREKLIPTYRIGCKRILMSNEYYPALQRPNVDVITGKDGAIVEITETGIRTADGRHTELDAIIWATGFQEADALAPFPIYGQDGRELSADWGTSPEAYKGTCVHGYPNLYLLVGPNTGLGHSSMIIMIEAQIRYLMQALAHQQATGVRALDVNADVQARYNARLMKRLDRTVWATGCNAWYTNAEGRNTTLWPGSTTEFEWMMRSFDPDAYTVLR